MLEPLHASTISKDCDVKQTMANVREKTANAHKHIQHLALLLFSLCGWHSTKARGGVRCHFK